MVQMLHFGVEDPAIKCEHLGMGVRHHLSLDDGRKASRHVCEMFDIAIFIKTCDFIYSRFIFCVVIISVLKNRQYLDVNIYLTKNWTYFLSLFFVL
jgi:hypothetical protein